jgi:Ca-activated chloride channel family protein
METAVEEQSLGQSEAARRLSLTAGVAVALAVAIATVTALTFGVRGAGARTGLPAVASLADAHMGTLLLRDGESYVEAPRLATDVDISVSGPTLRGRVTQMFNNRRRTGSRRSTSIRCPTAAQSIRSRW